MSCLTDFRPLCSAESCPHTATALCGQSGCSARFCDRHISKRGPGGLQICAGCLKWIIAVEILTSRRPVVAAKLEELAALPVGWNGERSAVISREAITRALTLLEAVITDQTPAPNVVPLSTGGVQVEWHTGGFDLELEVYPAEIRGWVVESARKWEQSWIWHKTRPEDDWLFRAVLAEMTERGNRE